MTVTASLPPASRPAFAHASEAELARILDFYQVRWTYEPDTFPIGWAMSGEVVESFSPDFYLPDLDLYVELTTLKQKLVRKKNRKLRRLRELYPDVRIKLFYARDFRMLLLKFGRLALLDDLSGTTGQATPPRPADRIVTEAGAAAGLRTLPESRRTGPGTDVAVPDASGTDGAPDVDLASGLDALPAEATPLDGPVHAGRASSTARGRRRGRRRRRDGAGTPEGLDGLEAVASAATGAIAGQPSAPTGGPASTPEPA